MENSINPSIMKRCPCFEKLDQEQIQQLCQIGKYDIFEKGEIIIHENEKSSRLYLILSGRVEIQRELKTKNTVSQISITSLSKDNIVGEISFLDNAPRCSSVVALRTTMTLSWTEDEIKNKIPNGDLIIQKLKNNIVREISDRLRSTNERYVDTIKKHLDVTRHQIEFGRLFILMMILMAINSALIRIVSVADERFYIDPHTEIYSWVYLLVITFIVLTYLGFDISKLKEFGVTLVNLKKSIIHGLLYGIILTGVILFCLYLHTLINPHFVITAHLNPAVLSVTTLISYPFNVYLQEFIARGIILNSICKFYRDKPLYFPVVLSSFIFGIFHFTYGLLAFVVTFIASIIFSMIYLRDKNLVGVTITHSIVGWVAFYIGLI